MKSRLRDLQDRSHASLRDLTAADADWNTAIEDMHIAMDSESSQAIEGCMVQIEIANAARMACIAAACYVLLESCRESLRGIEEEREIERDAKDGGLS